jgi:type VI secretion system protein ImpC
VPDRDRDRDRREAELAKNGFMPLVHRKNSDFAAFIGAQSLQKPAEYDDPDATANANLAARCPTCSPPAASRTT